MQRMPRSFWASVCAALAIGSALGAGGCISAAACDTSDDANPIQTYTGGTTTGGVYESSPWHSAYLDFPGGHRYAFVHGLGRAPPLVQVYLAFVPDPDWTAPCSGNSCEISVTDTVVQVKNDTCSEFWVKVVASIGLVDAGVAGD